MRTVRAAMVLVTALTVGSLLSAQAPDVVLPPGDAVRGKAIFEGTKGNCLSCHRVGGAGSLYGPNLSAVGLPPRGGGGGRGFGAPAGPPANPAPAGPPANPAPAGPPANPAPAAAGPPAAPQAGRAAGPPVAPPAGANPQQLAQSILDPNAVVTVPNRYVRLSMKDGRTIWGKLLNLDTFFVQIFDSTEKLANISRQDVREMTMTSPMPSYRDKLSTQEVSDVVSYLSSLKGQ